MKLTTLFSRFALDVSGSQSAANDAVSTGTNAINSFDPKQITGAQQQNTNVLGSQLAGQTGDYTSRYASAVANNPTVTSLYNTANSMYNVPGLAQNATNLSNRVTNAVPEAYLGARGYDIGATDINNGVASKLSYLTPQSNAATANYNTAAGLASNFVNASIEQNKQNLLPIQAEAPFLAQSEAAQATGWNQAAKSEFDGLIAKMQQGVTLSGQEMQRANQLAQLEESYQQAIDQSNIANQFKILQPSETLANTMTGATQRFK